MICRERQKAARFRADKGQIALFSQPLHTDRPGQMNESYAVYILIYIKDILSFFDFVQHGV